MQVRTTKVGLKIWHKSRRDTQRMGGEFCAFNFAEGCSLSPEFHSSFPPHWRYSDPQMGEGSVDPTLLARDGPAFVYATTAPKPSRRPRQCSGHIRGGGAVVWFPEAGQDTKAHLFLKNIPGFLENQKSCVWCTGALPTSSPPPTRTPPLCLGALLSWPFSPQLSEGILLCKMLWRRSNKASTLNATPWDANRGHGQFFFNWALRQGSWAKRWTAIVARYFCQQAPSVDPPPWLRLG